jgi:hypothetical protein
MDEKATSRRLLWYVEHDKEGLANVASMRITNGSFGEVLDGEFFYSVRLNNSGSGTVVDMTNVHMEVRALFRGFTHFVHHPSPAQAWKPANIFTQLFLLRRLRTQIDAQNRCAQSARRCHPSNCIILVAFFTLTQAIPSIDYLVPGAGAHVFVSFRFARRSYLVFFSFSQSIRSTKHPLIQ